MKPHTHSVAIAFRHRLVDYAQLTKFKLGTLVVFSALCGYFVAVDLWQMQWMEVLFLTIGGYLVTGASNALNQCIEKDFDRLMQRTSSRPLPDGRMDVLEAATVAVLIGAIGIAILWLGLNPLSGILGALALVLYVAVYTPLKRIGPVAAFAGAFPGAIPPMLGYVAATGEFGLVPGMLFAVQFFWQFPHFWAIAWKSDEDYKKAGFKLLPTASGKSRFSAFIIALYALFLVPVSIMPVVLLQSHWVVLLGVSAAGLWFLYYALKLFRTLDDRDALKLMFASFLYLPVVQLLYLI
ncbi:MAG: heme o synthase [Salibacteraceae bacterium]